ncbi:MAG: hypothetical protein IRY99_01710 [Isosphaeraceae bacterium]|nr:hypothetical protein [Isosphaeraceae bacterium]
MTPHRHAEGPVRIQRRPDRIEIETPHYRAAVATEGYVSGIAAGSFLDKKTGARDLGFGLSIVDFLLEPAPPGEPIPKGQYQFGPDDKIHGNLPKRYVEGPQICTQARRLPATVLEGDGFAAVRLTYRWHIAYPPHPRAGSAWEQTLIFPGDGRYLLSADRVTTVSESPELFLRIDMPGHIKIGQGPGFEHIYLSYHDPAVLPATEFAADFAPDEKFLYRRGQGLKPERFLRAYQVHRPDGREGPWLAGMTLNADDVYQAWCHRRGYVCLIEEIGGRPTKPGDTFGACYLLGWFDDLDALEAAYDRFRGFSGLVLDGPADRPTGFRGLKQDELTPVSI